MKDATPKPQIRRLLGNSYSIISDNRWQFEGIALHTDIGTIEGVRSGGYEKIHAQKNRSECDAGFASQIAVITLKNGFQFELAAFHLHSLTSIADPRTTFHP